MLCLTATPFSIGIDELISTIDLVTGNSNVNGTKALRDFHCFAVAAQRGTLEKTFEDFHEWNEDTAYKFWKNAVTALKPWLIRHTLNDLNPIERKLFGTYEIWDIKVPDANNDTKEILARADRLLNLKGGPKSIRAFRGSDPRFHIGWQYLEHLLTDAYSKLPIQGVKDKNTLIRQHIAENEPLGKYHAGVILKKISTLRTQGHPKIDAVVKAVLERLNEGEKVVVFCHHHATGIELGDAFKHELREPSSRFRPTKKWKIAWESLIDKTKWHKNRREAVLQFVSSSPFYRQVTGWLSSDKKELIDLFSTKKVRGVNNECVPSIWDALKELVEFHFEGTSNQDEVPNFLNRKEWMWSRIITNLEVEENLLHLFNSPFGPDLLIATDRLSEGIDLHRCCRLLVHYELDPSPVRVRQREGRIRRVGGWGARIGKPIEYAYPFFGQTRDELLVRTVNNRLQRFDLLLGAAPLVADIDAESNQLPNTDILSELYRKVSQNTNPLALEK